MVELIKRKKLKSNSSLDRVVDITRNLSTYPQIIGLAFSVTLVQCITKPKHAFLSGEVKL